MRFIPLIVVVVVGLFLLTQCWGPTCQVTGDGTYADEDVSTPKNIVLVIVDDLGWRDLGTYGSTFYETPHIDALAAKGTKFTQFYSASPVCSPTRASIMTGKHPAQLDLTNWIGGSQNGKLQQADYVRQLAHEEVSIAEVLKESGYRTGYAGKWHLGKRGFLPESQGFDWQFAVNEAGQPGSYFPPYGNKNWKITNVPDLDDDASEDAYLTDRLTDVALTFLKKDTHEPFFLVLSHYAVHTPLQAPKPMVARYQKKAAALGPASESDFEKEHESINKRRQDHATYAAMIEATDRSVGRVMETLKSIGKDKETVIVFVSDNGGLSTLRRKSFSMATSNVPLRSGKGWLYEGGIRIPLIVYDPSQTAGAKVDTRPAMTTDLLPTILSYARVPQEKVGSLHGESLLAKPDQTARPLYWHFPHYHGSGMKPAGAVRVGPLKLIEWFETGEVELYNLEKDLSEQENLAAKRPSDVKRLKGLLESWRKKVGANMPKALKKK